MNLSSTRYRNYQKTEEAIINALTALYKEKRSIHKITVKELCEVANISRSTFYLHYQDLISIFETIGNKFVDSLKLMVQNLSFDPKNPDFTCYIETIFVMLEESSDIIKMGLSSEYPLVYIDKIKNELIFAIQHSSFLIKTKLTPSQSHVEIQIMIAGLIDFVIGLLRSGEKIDSKKHINTINQFLMRWVKTLQ